MPTKPKTICGQCELKPPILCVSCIARIRNQFCESSEFRDALKRRDELSRRISGLINGRPQRLAISQPEIIISQAKSTIQEIELRKPIELANTAELKDDLDRIRAELRAARFRVYRDLSRTLFGDLHQMIKVSLNSRTIELWNSYATMSKISRFAVSDQISTGLLVTWTFLLLFRIFVDFPLVNRSQVSGKLFIRNLNVQELDELAQQTIEHVEVLLNCCSMPYNRLVLTKISIASGLSALLSCALGFNHRPDYIFGRFELKQGSEQFDWEILDKDDFPTN